ncbi:mechanosensitive ion channel domain-containing protein [Emcibacter sp. SYSU 3D8]|uniref:mechanosensitive ion channel family protein n=1 Tax=Emcibacter sp. SYSU 3D8 TaxID=3133969 RepID=UPI0031FE5554
MDQVWHVLELSWHWLSYLATATLFKVNRVEVTSLGLIQVIVVLCAAWWLSRLLQRTLLRFATGNRSISPASLYTLGRLIHYVIIALSLLLGLSMLGLDFSNLAFMAGAIGVGLGFGLQTLVSNFVSGIMLLVERSLKVGDFVELESGITGEVKEINIRSTLITTNDNVDILVPNSEFVSGRMTNWTLREDYRRLRVPFGVAYGTEKELVKKAGIEAARSVEHTMDDKGRDPDVWMVGFGDSSVDYELVVWLKPPAVKRPGRVRADYLWALDTALKKYDIEIPFPQRDLHLRSGFEALRSPSSSVRKQEDEDA